MGLVVSLNLFWVLFWVSRRGDEIIHTRILCNEYIIYMVIQKGISIYRFAVRLGFQQPKGCRKDCYVFHSGRLQVCPVPIKVPAGLGEVQAIRGHKYRAVSLLLCQVCRGVSVSNQGRPRPRHAILSTASCRPLNGRGCGGNPFFYEI